MKVYNGYRYALAKCGCDFCRKELLYLLAQDGNAKAVPTGRKYAVSVVESGPKPGPKGKGQLLTTHHGEGRTWPKHAVDAAS